MLSTKGATKDAKRIEVLPVPEPVPENAGIAGIAGTRNPTFRFAGISGMASNFAQIHCRTAPRRRGKRKRGKRGELRTFHFRPVPLSFSRTKNFGKDF